MRIETRQKGARFVITIKTNGAYIIEDIANMDGTIPNDIIESFESLVNEMKEYSGIKTNSYLSPETIEVIRKAIQVYRDVYADHILKAKEEIDQAQQEFNAVYGEAK